MNSFCTEASTFKGAQRSNQRRQAALSSPTAVGR